MKKVLIIGAGFAGIRAALSLQDQKGLDVSIISNNPNFEYYPGLHKLVGVENHPVVSIPLEKIFAGKNVKIIPGKVSAVDPVAKTASIGSQTFAVDYMILAMGSQTEYFNIPGLSEMSYGFKSVSEAQKLRAHIEDIFSKYGKTIDKAESVVGLHIVVVGAGPNGTDLAGELASFGHMLARKNGVTESLMTIDLIEGAPRVLPMMSESISRNVQRRLRLLGVNVFCNRDLRKEDSWSVMLADMTIGAKTLVWTAGITTNELVKQIPGLKLVKKNRVTVDAYLQADGFENIFVVGDCADTLYAGLAQTAIYDAQFVAQNIIRKEKNETLQKYAPHKIAYNIGVGPGWSVMVWRGITLYGFFAYVMRTLIDIKFFLSVLPMSEVFKLYF